MTDIVHRGIWKDGKQFYICNQVVKSNPLKLTMMWADVTCKNCNNKIHSTEVR